MTETVPIIPQSPTLHETDGVVDRLETHRFDISPESLAAMKSVRTMLPEARRANPAVQGVGFIGSRTRNQERPDSDLDLLVFSDQLIGPVSEADVYRLAEKTGLQPDDPNADQRLRFNYDISYPTLRDSIKTLSQAAGLIAEFDEADALNGQPLIEMLHKHHVPSPYTYALFYLAVGNPVYRARKYILDELEKLPGQDGDRAMRMISAQVEQNERGNAQGKYPTTPRYNGLPTTVEAARAYFKTENYEIDEVDRPIIADPAPAGWVRGSAPTLHPAQPLPRDKNLSVRQRLGHSIRQVVQPKTH